MKNLAKIPIELIKEILKLAYNLYLLVKEALRKKEESDETEKNVKK